MLRINKTPKLELKSSITQTKSFSVLKERPLGKQTLDLLPNMKKIREDNMFYFHRSPNKFKYQQIQKKIQKLTKPFKDLHIK